MGDLIYLDQRRNSRSESVFDPEPVFFFDLGCPLSYLTAELVEWTLGEVHWVPVASAAMRPRCRRELDSLCTRAEARARELRLPLLWPERFPAATPGALRAAAHAAELGVGPRFALAASRLAFCGGFDLEDPEALTEAAAAAGVPLDACLSAAGDPAWDEPLQTTAELLGAHGVAGLPAFRVAGRWFGGEAGLLGAAAALLLPTGDRRPMMPVG